MAMSCIKEVWRDVVGWEGFYEVSSFGNVKSLSRLKKTRNKHGPISYMTTTKLLALNNHDDGYKQVRLCGKGLSEMKKVHRLVAEAFIPNLEGLPQVNHKNSIRYDNRVDNLEWCDNQYNVKHSYSTGSNSNKGILHPRKVLDNKTVYKIRAMYDSGKRCVDIAKEVGFKTATVEKAAWRVNWKHLEEI